MSGMINRHIVLASRPRAEATVDNFRLETGPVPEPGEGQMLVQTLWLSLDPYMRGRMNDVRSYTPPYAIGETMGGATIGRVVKSNLPKFSEGDLVSCMNGWQDYALSDGSGVAKLGASMPRPSLALGVLGMPGFTGWYGLTRIGEPKPGETVVVAAATGAVGSAVGQTAKLRGCRAVGIAGGPEKCAYAVQTLGLDACIDHTDPDFRRKLAEACPQGIDVYFENVAGKVLMAVLPLLNTYARIPLCGIISVMNGAPPEGPDRSGLLMSILLTRKVKLQGFIISDHYEQYPAFLAEMAPLVQAGKIAYREDVADGLESAPTAFIGMLEGRNFGKQIVRVAD